MNAPTWFTKSYIAELTVYSNAMVMVNALGNILTAATHLDIDCID